MTAYEMKMMQLEALEAEKSKPNPFLRNPMDLKKNVDQPMSIVNEDITLANVKNSIRTLYNQLGVLEDSLNNKEDLKILTDGNGCRMMAKTIRECCNLITHALSKNLALNEGEYVNPRQIDLIDLKTDAMSMKRHMEDVLDAANHLNKNPNALKWGGIKETASHVETLANHIAAKIRKIF